MFLVDEYIGGSSWPVVRPKSNIPPTNIVRAEGGVPPLLIPRMQCVQNRTKNNLVGKSTLYIVGPTTNYLLQYVFVVLFTAAAAA